MSFYDDASLVVIPSAQKTSKLYAVKPTDGSGDLAFTRTGDTATRVNSAGLIEEVRTNLLLQSNTFSTTWINSDSTETGGQAGYDGTNNAWLLTSTILGGFIYQTVSISGQTTFSVYAKAGSQNGIILYSVHVAQGRNFNLSTGAVGGAFVAAPDSSQIQSVGNGWYRCSITVSSSSTNHFRIYVGDGSSTALGNVVIQNSQCEKGDIATAYIPTTTAAVSVGPVANVPRLDYLGSTCPRLLLEPQRTNLVTYSEQFDNAAWAKSNATITANSVVSPDGYTNADTYTATGGANYVSGGATSTGSNTITYSVFVKAGTQSTFRVREAFYFGTATIFNLSSGTITSGTGTITNYGNGWYRCTHTQAYGAGQTNVSVIFDTTASSGTFYLWGAQFEVGAYATSYIPTLAASATRAGDFPSKSNINALIGGTSGTVFFEIKTNSTLTSTNYKQFFYYTGASSGQAYMYISNINVLVTNPSLGSINGSLTFQPNTIYKIALAYATNDFKLYINGVARGTSTSGTPLDAVNLLSLGSLSGSSEFNEFTFAQYLHFKTRLTNAELAELTTL